MKVPLSLFLALILNLFLSRYGWSQDSLSNSTKIKNEIIGAITKNPKKDSVINKKSEDAFLPYQGKVIRKIIIQHMGFERTFYNGTSKARKAVVDIGNALHTDTRDQIIRDNLFIEENKLLNPYKVADNERYLRDLQFILDARIEPHSVGNDSVDLVVITRDVFSLGGRFSPRDANEVRFGIYDANLLGLGQRVEYNAIIDGDKNPTYGQEMIYEKSSIGGTLVNLMMGYTSINTGSSYGDEYESSTYLKLNRPLVSPYTSVSFPILVQLKSRLFLCNNYNSNVVMWSTWGWLCAVGSCPHFNIKGLLPLRPS